ncbi:MAG: hypothetical protein FD124_2060 [Alphaproteobacteria bacterium]|nr:MAG: hypothetical protein FD160_1113 [Caulobacteraceae bacterium]TPW05636.1 MAG: hypothetical protein FD124_2060 [Alphaproteobacteria bacterium]
MQHWSLTWRARDHAFEGDAACADADFALYFAGREAAGSHSIFNSLRRLCPHALIMGCSTGTVIDGEELHDDEAVAVAVRLDRATVALARVAVTGQSSFEDGRALATQLRKPGLVGVLVLSDGLNVNGTALVAGLQDILGADIPIGGGMAGDGSAFARTLVCADAPPAERIVAALGFYGDGLTIRLGAAHGWNYFGPTRRITRSDGAVLHEMDGKPALDLYERYLGEEAADLPASALLYPLLVTNPDAPEDEVVRTVLAVDREHRTMTFAGDIPQGWSARLMRGAFDSLAAGAAQAAAEASGAPGEGGLALLISCVGRRLLMGQRAEDEVEAVAGVLSARFRQIGFYSYGEIATQGVAGWCGLHNQTMTIMTLQEAA